MYKDQSDDGSVSTAILVHVQSVAWAIHALDKMQDLLSTKDCTPNFIWKIHIYKAL
jgi:hypothetical protein